MKEFETLEELIRFINYRLERLNDVQVISNGRTISLSYSSRSI